MIVVGRTGCVGCPLGKPFDDARHVPFIRPVLQGPQKVEKRLCRASLMLSTEVLSDESRLRDLQRLRAECADDYLPKDEVVRNLRRGEQGTDDSEVVVAGHDVN